jgi:hypothetical protein
LIKSFHICGHSTFFDTLEFLEFQEFMTLSRDKQFEKFIPLLYYTQKLSTLIIETYHTNFIQAHIKQHQSTVKLYFYRFWLMGGKMVLLVAGLGMVWDIRLALEGGAA